MGVKGPSYQSSSKVWILVEASMVVKGKILSILLCDYAILPPCSIQSVEVSAEVKGPPVELNSSCGPFPSIYTSTESSDSRAVVKIVPQAADFPILRVENSEAASGPLSQR